MAAFEERQALELQKKAAERIRLMEEREKQAEAERLASEERMKKNLMKYEEWKRNKAKQVRQITHHTGSYEVPALISSSSRNWRKGKNKRRRKR